jgi:hypothetical protein
LNELQNISDGVMIIENDHISQVKKK